MPIDFFKSECQSSTTESTFGICDDDDETPAYITNNKEHTWVAIIKNEQSKLVNFTAIDKCIDFPLVDGKMQSRCDAMLICDNCLYVIELKNKNADWQLSGIDQLESTVKNLMASLGITYNNYRLRKAYVANKRHPSFHLIKNETMEKFRHLYKIRLDLQAIIKIV